MQDLAINRVQATGRFTFRWDPAGDLVFDETGTYPVLSTFYTVKGSYYWDTTGEQGTRLHLVKQDVFSTGSQLAAYAQDALDQAKAEGVITEGSSEAQRIQRGRWEVLLRWKIHEQPQSIKVRL